jgi:Response regulators consisting of a CheY-like receiver domain and a winged-helix DNA-binding domain
VNTRKKIIIIDDDLSFLESAEEVLKTENFDVIKALNAESGIEALALENPDLILLDVNLPDKNGFEVLRIIKTSKNFSQVPVILITGDMAVHVDKGFSEGADDCVFKPIDIAKLVTNINRLLK